MGTSGKPSAISAVLAPLRRFFGRFSRSRSGAAAVEFALVSVPFLALLFAIIETGMVFFAQEELQTATADAARLIMTGQAQIQNMSQAQFQQAVCARAVAMFSCPGLYVNVQTFQSFSGVSLLDPLQNGNFNANALNYNLGGPGSIVMLQVFYEWPIPTNIGGIGLANMSGNNRLMMATAVFRSEPY
jgi:Flp pilus assembly protein TadG